MAFSPRDFVLFFAVVFALYWLTPWREARVWLLLIASVAFYASWSQYLAAVVCATACLDYLLARAMDGTHSDRLRRALMVLSVCVNLGVLVYFKYRGFFLNELHDLLSGFGVSPTYGKLTALDIIVPLGISFYTFEAISYTVDVYRRVLPAEKNLAHFLLFILFFPHLLAGPIVRARDFLPQVRRRKRWNWVRIGLGVQLCVLGVVKKFAIADRMAMFADPVFADPLAFKTTALWIGTVAYLIQVYCDFSGYSDIALGTAHLLGYRLCWNFNLPYVSVNPVDFWRRWHISLSTWLRDYVFFPLGGSRYGEVRTWLNMLFVFTLCGLWHGATWPCVMWGFLTGAWMCLHRGFRGVSESLPAFDRLLQTRPGTVFRVGCTLLIFTSTLAVFRSPTLAEGFTMLGRLFVPVEGARIVMKPESFAVLTAVVLAAHLAAVSGWWQRAWEAAPAPARGLGLAGAMAAALLFAPDSGQAFIYFQF